MSIGFTGTRDGMTAAQKLALEEYLDMFLFKEPWGAEFNHGAADGADNEASLIAVTLGYKEKPFPAGDDPLVRDRSIVHNSDFMLATTKNNCNIYRGSGTWYTIRYTNTKRLPGITIWPDGTSSPIRVLRKP